MKLRTGFLAIALISSTNALAAPTEWRNTGHWYEFIDTPVTATEAFTLAQASTFSGMQGYLVTVTSAGENRFVSYDIARGSAAWLGGSDADAPVNHWTWRNGPEAGQAFTFEGWSFSEPNNCCGGEDYVYTYGGRLWNDDGPPSHSGVAVGYVIEYGDTVLAPIPEPQTYLMLVAGVGLLGFMVRRKNARKFL